MGPAHLLFVFTSVLTTLTSATPLGPVNSLVKEIIDLPQGWTRVGIPQPTDTLRLSFALKQNNINGLIKKLDEIADPDSPNFRQWLTDEEVAAYSAPAPQTVSAVTAWLTSSGIPAESISQTMDMLQVTVPIHQAESLLGTQYLLYSKAGQSAVARTIAYSLPANLHGLIDTVQPTTAFVSRAKSAMISVSASEPQLPTFVHEKRATTTCDPDRVYPSCILAEYSVDHVGTNRSTVASASNGTPANHTDANLWRRTVGVTGADFIDSPIDGGKNTGQANFEGNIDTQLTLGLGSADQAYYLISPSNADLFMELGTYLQTHDAPGAISISYGFDESDASPSYATRICNLFAQAGAKGITIFIASGDNGVGGDSGPASCDKFLADFPSVCPYVTAVGATKFKNVSPFAVGSSSDKGEIAANFGSTQGSGGGFSNLFATPSWQQSAVKAYVTKLNGTYAGRYNASGRGIPDVSALGLNWYAVVNGAGNTVSGTSASAPAWAGILSLLNDVRAAQGKARLGFINPSIYKNPGFFNDITSGNNNGCGTKGFPALAGWDAASGLGTPNFTALRNL